MGSSFSNCLMMSKTMSCRQSRATSIRGPKTDESEDELNEGFDGAKVEGRTRE